MPLADIKSAISQNAHAEREEMLERAREEVRTIERETREAEEKMRREAAADLEKAKQENKRRVKSAARQAGRLVVGVSRRETLDRVFSDALARLRDLSEDEYERVLSAFLDGLPDAPGTLFVDPRRHEAARELLVRRGRDCNVASDETLSGGAVFSTGSDEYNLDFGRRLSDLRPELELELGRILFESNRT